MPTKTVTTRTHAKKKGSESLVPFISDFFDEEALNRWFDTNNNKWMIPEHQLVLYYISYDRY